MATKKEKIIKQMEQTKRRRIRKVRIIPSVFVSPLHFRKQLSIMNFPMMAILLMRVSNMTVKTNACLSQKGTTFSKFKEYESKMTIGKAV